MDRVTRYPIFSIPHSPRVAGKTFKGDTSYSFELVGVGPVARGWGQNEPVAWPADHEASLETVQMGTSLSLRGFPGRLAPRLPCPEDDEEMEVKAYHLEARDTLPSRPRDLEWERRLVIQDQAVRKSSTVAMLHGTPDHGEPRSPGRPQSMPLEENMIDTEQIDFLAARRQFMSLEQTNPPSGVAHARAGVPQDPPPGVAQIPPAGASQASKALNGPPLVNGCVVPVKPEAKEVVTEEKRVHGLPTRPGAQALDDPGSWSQEGSPEPAKETPIEREIRLAQKREADLREQRGLQRAASQQELLEIPARPLLSKASLATAPRLHRGRPSLYVQRDMAQESQREEDHRREGLQLGRASTSDWFSEGPQPILRRVHSSDSILSPTPDGSAASPTPEVRKVNRIPPDAYLSPRMPPGESPAFHTYRKPSGLSADEARPVGSPKATGSQRHPSGSSAKPSSTKQEPPRGPLRANRGVVRWEYFCLRPLRFGVLDEPEKAEAPRVWGWEVAGAPALRLQKSQSSELLEREVESVLRREQEVADERRSALYPEVFSPPPDDCCDLDSRSSSGASGITGSYSVSESHFFTPIHLHSGLMWTAEASAEDAPRERKKNEQWVSLEPCHALGGLVLGATRVTRHKNSMAECWETRIYASEDED
ncbi:mitotic interactor and substrate of PLK1 [Mesoplodon densirostris]|uniref:mitotic interactor and substrate of PLK1 n=1 Tax=Mesoplodon densirostris TaxID=48708 RepID=UPI0028DBCCB7|nr:mitotic interactor and substrate of PLK1 [Mesoplodon densirostris]